MHGKIARLLFAVPYERRWEHKPPGDLFGCLEPNVAQISAADGDPHATRNQLFVMGETKVRGPSFRIDDQLGSSTVRNGQAKSATGVGDTRRGQDRSLACQRMPREFWLRARPCHQARRSALSRHPRGLQVNIGHHTVGLGDFTVARKIELDEFDESDGVHIKCEVLILARLDSADVCDPVATVSVGRGLPDVDQLRGDSQNRYLTSKQPETNLSARDCGAPVRRQSGRSG